MKEILITNDDGFESEGLKKLIKMLKKEFKAKITIVAPATEKSACSHSITLTKPLRFIKVGKDFTSLMMEPLQIVFILLFMRFIKRVCLIL
ncbi:5-nucleotidase SurE [Campylobacter coli]|nr:5-nucleotidase SurE [Campylobacter coli]